MPPGPAHRGEDQLRFLRAPLITYASEPGSRVPAYLLIPKAALDGKKKLPAILALHPTDMEYGHRVVVEQLRANYRAYGRDLAERGYVVLAPAYPLMANYQPDLNALGYQSGTMKAIWDNIRGLDLLESLPFVRKGSFGAIGHSLGGHNAIFTAVFDPRIRVVVSSCGFDSFLDYYGGDPANWHPERGWCQTRYMPRLADYRGRLAEIPFDFHEAHRRPGPAARLRQRPAPRRQLPLAKRGRHPDRRLRHLSPLPRAAEPPSRASRLRTRLPPRRARSRLPLPRPAPALVSKPSLALRQRQQAGRTPNASRHPSVAGQSFCLSCQAELEEGQYMSDSHRTDGKSHCPVMLALAFVCVLSYPCRAAEAPKTNAAPPAALDSPTNALASFRLKAGFRLELVAAEPLIAAPAAIAFDENDRLFVAETRGTTGQRGANAPMGRIRLLEDTDGTGEFHSSTIYANRLPWASALACYGGGVFVAAGPDILYLKDSHTNGIADVRAVAFTILAGTNTPNALGLPNNFNWGLDNRIHSASAGTADDVAVSRASGTAPASLDSAFSFDPRALTIASDGVPAPSGLTFDNWGRMLVCDFTRPLRLPLFPARYRERNPFFPAPPEMADVLSPATAIFRLGTQAPNVLAATWLTNALGCVIYRGSAFPSDYLGNAFIPDPFAHIVHRAVLREAGLQLTAARATDEPRSEFLMSSDPAFHPVQAVNGPDGALYIVDAQDGRDRGRIYRIVPEGFKRPKSPRLGRARSADLVAMLSHPNGWHRDTAARLLYERRDPASVKPLMDLLYYSRVPLARLHALHTLDGLACLTQAQLLRALGDPDERVCEHAVLLSEKRAVGGVLPDPLWNRLRPLTADPALRVRYQLALTLGEFRQPGSADVLSDLLGRTPANPSMEAAVFSSLADGAGAVFNILVNDPRIWQSPSGQALLRRLVTMIGVRAEPKEVAQLVSFLGGAPPGPPQLLPLVVALGEGLRQAGGSLAQMDPQGVLQRYNSDASNMLFGFPAADPLRLAGIRLLAVLPSTFTDSGDLLLLPLASGQADVAQSAMIATLAGFDDPRVPPALFRRWATLTLPVRSDAATALLHRGGRATVVLDALENGIISRADLTPAAVNILRTDADPAVAQRAVRLLGPVSVQRPDVVQLFKPALALKGVRDSGRDVFVQRCAACHQPSGAEPAIGPDLATARIYGKERAFTAILEPNLQVRPGYETCVLATAGGELFWGILRDGNPTTVTLQPLNGASFVLRRANIPYLQPRSWSLMPEGLKDGLTPQSLADLLEYLVAAPL